MSDAYLDFESRMAEAVSAWNPNVPRSIRDIAREFNVGRTALANRLNGGAHDLLDHQPTEHSQKPKNTRFVITLNVLINVGNHLNFQWLKVRQTTY